LGESPASSAKQNNAFFLEDEEKHPNTGRRGKNGGTLYLVVYEVINKVLSMINSICARDS